jgi:SAM-dependent methyltransferase
LANILDQQANSLPKRVFGSEPLSPANFLEIYIEEARFLYELVAPHLRRGMRLLEIGGGLGLFHIILDSQGFEIVSVEPSEAGFAYFRSFGLPLVTEFTGRRNRFLDARAEHLPWKDNNFDLTVSHNVLEHVVDPIQALREMYRVTVPGGRLIHSCPNYLMPYEPHYKVPIIPCAVRLSGKIWWRRYQSDPLWRSINSINAFAVMKAVHRIPGAQLTFHNAIKLTFARLESCRYLAERHGMLTRLVQTASMKALLSALPPQLVSPMVFEIMKPPLCSIGVANPT